MRYELRTYHTLEDYDNHNYDYEEVGSNKRVAWKEARLAIKQDEYAVVKVLGYHPQHGLTYDEEIRNKGENPCLFMYVQTPNAMATPISAKNARMKRL